MTDLMPTWLGERTNMIDAEDETTFDETLSAVIAKDKNNIWFTAFGSSLKARFSDETKSYQHLMRKGLGEKQMQKYSKGQRIPHVIYHNWVVNTPLETGIADSDKAQIALKKAKTYENPYGVFVTGIDRTEEADSMVLKSRKKIFSYTGAVMTLPTSVLAVSAAHYGNPEEALQYIHKLHQSFSYALPGSMYEVSPDFGMMTQAWNIFGVAVPIVQYFFGVQPKKYEKNIDISPGLPTNWKDASLEKVKVGNNSFNISIRQNIDYKEYHIQQTQSDWTLEVSIENAKKIMVNGKEVDRVEISGKTIKLSGRENRIQIY